MFDQALGLTHDQAPHVAVYLQSYDIILINESLRVSDIKGESRWEYLHAQERGMGN